MAVLNYKSVKAMWLSQFDLASVYQKDGVQRQKAEFTDIMENIFAKLYDMGINTAIVQMRPNADSMYPSKIYPMSKYVVGAYGREAEYDPVEIIISIAHKFRISVHAWINPMRCMTETEIKLISDKYAVGKWYNGGECENMLVKVNNNYYFDPAYSQVRQLIVSGAEEILDTYEFDGLHMDDYFYPTVEASFDAYSYGQYVKNGGTLALEDFRRDNLDKLVSSLYSLTKSKNEELLFGISPAGVISSVLNRHFANVEKWCSKDGFIDYICPQIYFGIEHPTCPYFKLCDDWQAMIKNDNVKLMIGMTLGKAKAGKDEYAKENSDEWSRHKDIMVRCLEKTRHLRSCIGVSYFCYQYFYNSVTGAECEETREERSHLIPLLKEISW